MSDNNSNYDRDKLEGQELTLVGESKIAKWVSNFWYHHKWTFIIVTFFVAVLIIVGVQMLTKEEYDATVTIAGPYSISSDTSGRIALDLESVMSKDISGDNKKNIQIVHYPVYSEKEMKEANQSETDNRGAYITKVNGQDNTTQYSTFFNYTSSGDCSIYFLSEYLYNILKKEDRLLSLSEVFGNNMPKGVLSDGYGVKLTDSGLYETFSSFEALSDDTVICIAKPLVWGKSSKEKIYNQAKEYFKEILECN